MRGPRNEIIFCIEVRYLRISITRDINENTTFKVASVLIKLKNKRNREKSYFLLIFILKI
ncbi:hypothetical protein NARC_170021 [Candidatus Nitrosocosmicus arcticus]|uniref:Uncharacterized protein n=1 Tax=Candidatus Nitrosocosmicus arcticus TaxID=2035267 RepID=A0A557SRP6_9ARCH|nr:hypothetical protein NARC_170021 [Candidatus Nitrosocosmicus arcticus]